VLILVIRIEVVAYFFVLTLLLSMIVSMAIRGKPLFHRVKNAHPSVVIDLVLISTLLPVCVALFGTSVYGNIKPQYGGGQPSRVRLLIQQDKITQLSTESGQMNLATMLAEAQLLDSSDDKLLLLLKASHGEKGLLMQLDRSLVGAVVYRSSTPSFVDSILSPGILERFRVEVSGLIIRETSH
jgi:hypothetical protein